MKTYLLPLLLFVLIALSTNGQTRNLNITEPVTGIDISSKSKIHLATGPQKIEIATTEGNEKSVVNNQNGTLRISGDASELYITLPDLQRIDISGVGTITADSLIKTRNLRIDISGIGKLIMPLETQRLQVGISGMGKLQLNGSAENVEMNISGNGKFDAINFRATNCVANVSGIMKSYMDVTGVLDLNISGTGSFYYRSTPAQINSSISGIGKHELYNANQEKDTTVIKAGNYDILIIGNNNNADEENSSWSSVADTLMKRPEYSRSHWMGVDLGFNYMAYGSGLSSDMPAQYSYLELNSGKSVNVNLNLFAHDFKLYKRYIMFTTGIGLTLNNYRFDGDSTLRNTNPLSAGLDTNNLGQPISYSKNKLAVNYFTLPLLLQFNTHELNKKSFHFATGVLLNYKYNSHLKLKYSEDGDTEKEKRHKEYNIQPFRADLTFRAGYKNWTLYASYGLTELFRENRGPVVHPVQFGISFLGW
jgi:hypothetical protein